MSKVETLRSLVKEYVKYLDLWENVSVKETVKNHIFKVNEVITTGRFGVETKEITTELVEAKNTPFVEVKYHTPKGLYKRILHPDGFEAREFPLEEIDRRIIHYRNKLYNLKKKADEQN